MSGLLIAAPLGLEAALVRSGARGVRVCKTGMGPARSRASAQALLGEPGDALLVLGFCGGLDERARPGEVVIAEEVLAAADEGHAPARVACAGVRELTEAVERAGLAARSGRVVCVSRLALGERRAQLREDGAIAVDMESAWLAQGAGGRAFAVVRVVLDSPTHELLRPQAVFAALHAAKALRQVARALRDWRPPGVELHDRLAGS